MAKKATGQVYQLKITLRDIKPPVWRRVQVKDCSLAKLHDDYPDLHGLDGYHLHSFEIGGEQYSEPDPDGMMETEDERKVKLSQVVARGNKKFTYTYDLATIGTTHPSGEDARRGAGRPLPPLHGGKRACPPEDCGGAWGYGDFLEAIQNPKHPEHEEMLEWVGGEFDPEAFDIEAVNKELR